jgi:hypothetical protein
MQTVGTGYDLFQFHRDVILGTILDGLVNKLYDLHRGGIEPG